MLGCKWNVLGPKSWAPVTLQWSLGTEICQEGGGGRSEGLTYSWVCKASPHLSLDSLRELGVTVEVRMLEPSQLPLRINLASFASEKEAGWEIF